MLFDRVKVATATTGTGTITLGAAERDATNGDYLTFGEIGVADGDLVSYFIQDGANWASGLGTYTASGTTLSRDASEKRWNGSAYGTAALSLSGSAVVYISPRAADLVTKDSAGTASANAISLAGPGFGSFGPFGQPTLGNSVADDEGTLAHRFGNAVAGANYGLYPFVNDDGSGGLYYGFGPATLGPMFFSTPTGVLVLVSPNMTDPVEVAVGLKFPDVTVQTTAGVSPGVALALRQCAFSM